MGHTFQFFGGGGGGGHKKSSAGSSIAVGSLFNFDYHQFGVKPDTGGPGQNNSESDLFKYYCNLPDLGSKPYGSNRDDGGSIFNDIDFDWNHHGGNVGSGYVAQNNAPVAEPATIMLLGIGLIGLAAYGRKKFNN